MGRRWHGSGGQERFPKEKLAADGFAAFLSHRKVSRDNGVLCYQLNVAGCPMTVRFGVEHHLIPDPDPTFIWTDQAKDVAEAIEHNERVFLFGPSGTGKSSLVKQIAAAVKRPVRRVSLNGETSVADFIGHWPLTRRRGRGPPVALRPASLGG